MFDIGWSELLILGVMALIVVGPKELPGLLRTLGRYLGMIRKQASEFRTQFDEAIRETELDQIRKDVAGIKDDVASSMHDATRQVERDLDAGKIEPSTDAPVESSIDASDLTDESTSVDDDQKLETLDDPEPAKQVDTATNEPAPLAKSNAETSGAGP